MKNEQLFDAFDVTGTFVGLVQPFGSRSLALCLTNVYVERNGKPVELPKKVIKEFKHEVVIFFISLTEIDINITDLPGIYRMVMPMQRISLCITKSPNSTSIVALHREGDFEELTPHYQESFVNLLDYLN